MTGYPYSARELASTIGCAALMVAYPSGVLWLLWWGVMSWG